MTTPELTDCLADIEMRKAEASLLLATWRRVILHSTGTCISCPNRREKLAVPTLVLENVPSDVYERLARRAAAQKRSLPQETLVLLEQALQQERPTPRWPELIPTEE